MTEDPTEIPLSGGRTTPGVVRIRDSVRKPHINNSAFVTSLLEHLSSSGSDFSPEFQGIDDAGRMMLAYIDGNVPEDLSVFEDRTLRDAAPDSKIP